jgi:transcriptional regulator with XRE-family HTH domain
MDSDSKDARGFRARIAELRNARGLTQAKLSERVDRDNGYISRVETGEIEWPPLEQFSKIAEALDVPLLEIFNNDGMTDSEEELRARIERMIATADLSVLRKYFRILLTIIGK